MCKADYTGVSENRQRKGRGSERPILLDQHQQKELIGGFFRVPRNRRSCPKHIYCRHLDLMVMSSCTKMFEAQVCNVKISCEGRTCSLENIALLA